MRQLKPEIAERRKKDILQWAVHYYIKTSRPVSSSIIADEGRFKLSPATIRNILQELEEDGYLHQPHTSAGREPTDKGYRFFVDYLADVQRLAADEKEGIERQYQERMQELDILLSETSRLLSRVSRSAGLVLSPQAARQTLKRLEIIPLGGKSVLAILVTEAGLVRHWPIQLSFAPTARQINTLNRFLNENIRGCGVSQAQAIVMAKLKQIEDEFRDLSLLADNLLQQVGSLVEPGALFVEGADNILSQAEEIGDLKVVQSLMRVISEKNAIAGLLGRELKIRLQGKDDSAPKPRVRIGAESGIPELSSLSLVTTTYNYNGRVVGILGIMGSKRMEYPRMMSLVDYMSGLVTERLARWAKEDEE
ncbi:MAG: heat-inducible transcription repressor HrcA [Elusimicrobia bacterium]|nr:heat-inducible transcription repressor HrcA [Elusimicrobiota bacterium]MDE2313965.1 heat-inducible transcription repressor HrcA [Elusimicrobiota bacterium]